MRVWAKSNDILLKWHVHQLIIEIELSIFELIDESQTTATFTQLYLYPITSSNDRIAR